MTLAKQFESSSFLSKIRINSHGTKSWKVTCAATLCSFMRVALKLKLAPTGFSMSDSAIKSVSLRLVSAV